ncbi:chromosome segregation protein SMC [Pseudomonas putida]|uniref:chromosome segregation protein SMC n=1 Tax=Pseudomonas putida TaxID=303 RepID=UPI0023648CE9|nr:chromosome segregation protein SMC [Pseudomonas putida]MDD1990025.1 chromosome segregation protein SMC [Pseudomonas putida]HDS1796690.1 chromosome segregation protein SMC [Pseudomonas putida]
MKSLQKLNTERSHHQTELQEFEGQIAQWEVHLSDLSFAATSAGDDLLVRLREAKSKVGDIEYKISVIDQDIAWYDRKANSSALMAGYKENMESWSADKVDLEGKRKTLYTRLAETKSQSEKIIADARQSEEEAARAYAQAVAWSDVEGEKKAADDAQKAAKTLSSAMEHQRRQALIITAMEQEIETIDVHIEEAVQNVLKAERSAVWLVKERLEEHWDVTAKQLLDVGAQLYAAKCYLGHEQMAFLGFKVGSQTEGFTSWDAQDIAELSRSYSPSRIIDIQTTGAEQVDKAA